MFGRQGFRMREWAAEVVGLPSFLDDIKKRARIHIRARIDQKVVKEIIL